jgi:molybdopterin-containing oxidoreductase family iron-sulfur binding subunit
MQIGHRKNASSSACTHFFASHHPYETWRDFQADTFYAVSQPLIKPLFNTLPAHSVLAGIFGEKMDDYTAIKDDFEEQNITASWDELLRSGGSETKMKRNNTSPVMLKKNAPSSSDEEEGENYTVFVKQNIRLKYKEYYENPWLRECPDPFSRISWDDYLVVSSEVADHLNLEDGDEVLLNGWLQLPAYIQKNMHARSMILYWGTFDFAAASDDMNYEKKIWKNIRIRKTGTKTQFARIQTELNTSLPDHYFRPLDNKKEYLEKHYNGSKETFPMHHWGMVIDLDKCHGCNLCSIACINENNIPVVGREEILRRHEMHWLRVDRYYDNRGEMIFLPVMCQHCDEAPCENVCPVSATSQSKEGLNQMTYNRCIGARYCSNNCPYKVRRFNWKAYTGANGWFSKDYDPAGMNNDLTRMVLNPDITIRSRGVMEKCSFCIQRIAEKRQSAIMENRLLKDGEIKTACQQACPNNAIVFGDLKDQDSKVRHMIDNNEAYQLMGDLSTHPTVWYIKRKKT